MVSGARDQPGSTRRLLASVVAGIVVGLAAPTAAFAHATLLRVEPADGSVLRAAPAAVRLFFDDVIRPEPGMRAVRNAGGSALGGRPRVVDGRELVIPLRADLEHGSYTVLWRVLSDDGHSIAGVTTLAIGTGEPPPRPVLRAPSERQVVPGLERWLFLSGLLLAVGLALFRLVMPREAAPSLRLLAAAFCLTAGGGAALVARASLSTRFGFVVACAVAVALVGAIVALTATVLPRVAYAAWACGLALVAAPSLAGHALDAGTPRLELPVDVLHVAASSVWFGGVVALALDDRSAPFRDQVLRRFSTLALIAVSLVAATGLVRAVGELTSLGQVWGTSYGRWLIVKTGFFAVLTVLGWTNRYRLLPALARSRQRLRRNIRAELLLLLGLFGAVAILTESRPGRDLALAEAATGRVVATTPEEAVVIAQAGDGFQLAGEAVNGLSPDGRSILWETVPSQKDGGSAALVERNLSLGRTRTLVDDVAPLFGLGVIGTTVVYATATVPPHLVAMNLRTGRTTVLSGALAAPFAWRGDRVAWAEQKAGRQRVVVYDLLRRKTWTAADLPACVDGRCYRIDAVTLADRGVVFDRGAIGSQASFVIRRAFSDPRTTSARIERDPQPDLIPSAGGALYYALGRGWYRWDFGQDQPQRVAEAVTSSLDPLAYDRRTWLLLQHRGCDDYVIERREDGRSETLVSSVRTAALAGVGNRVCIRLQRMTWIGERRVTTWVVVPRAVHGGVATGVIVIDPAARS
jgi:copper transport protein